MATTNIQMYMSVKIQQIVLLIVLFSQNAMAQVIVQLDGYSDLKPGIYNTKSTDAVLIGFNPVVVEPQINFKASGQTAFLKVDKQQIALFDKLNASGASKPVGVLNKTSVIRVDTIFYQETFKDTTKEWFLTFNVWYAITINGIQYYTDFKVHDFIGYTMKLDQYKQEFLLVSQSDGYDGIYDSGYPNYFFVAVLNNKNELIFDSKILDFDFAEEYWDPAYVQTQMTNKGFEFTLIGLDKPFRAIWSGKDIIF